MKKKNLIVKYSQLVRGFRWYYVREQTPDGHVVWVSERYMSRNGRNLLAKKLMKEGNYRMVNE